MHACAHLCSVAGSPYAPNRILRDFPDVIRNIIRNIRKDMRKEIRISYDFIEDALAGRHRQTTLGQQPWPWQSAVVLGHCGESMSGVFVNLARTW